jgi:hypothetical protein
MTLIQQVLALMRELKYREAEELLARDDAQHCATCQCARIHGSPPAPGNDRSKSWHGEAPTTKPG